MFNFCIGKIIQKLAINDWFWNEKLLITHLFWVEVFEEERSFGKRDERHWTHIDEYTGHFVYQSINRGEVRLFNHMLKSLIAQ